MHQIQDPQEPTIQALFKLQLNVNILMKRLLYNPGSRKHAVLNMYRTHFKLAKQIPDTLLKQSLLFKLKAQYLDCSNHTSIYLFKKSFKLGLAFTIFLKRCLDKQKNSVLKLIRLSLMPGAEMIKNNHPAIRSLKKNSQFQKLNSRDAEFVKDIVVRCMNIDGEQELEGYLRDCSMQESAKGQKVHPIILQQIKNKIENREAYYQEYSVFFQGILGVAGDEYDQIIIIFQKSKFFFLI